jgi:repressor LexA
MKPRQFDNPRYAEILDFIRKFISERGFSPSIREISAHLGLDSTSLITYYLDQLEGMGELKRDRRIARSIVLTNKIPMEVRA